MSTDPYTEKREVPRWNLKIPLQIGMQSTDESIGDAVDISIRGIRVITEQSLPVGEALQLWMMLPTEAGGWSRVELEVEGVWHHQHDDGTVETGCKFVAIEPSVLMAIQSLIDEQMSFG